MCSVVQQEAIESILASSYECTIVQCLLRGRIPRIRQLWNKASKGYLILPDNWKILFGSKECAPTHWSEQGSEISYKDRYGERVKTVTYVFVDINFDGQHGHGAFDLCCGMLPYATDDNKYPAYDLSAQNTVLNSRFERSRKPKLEDARDTGHAGRQPTAPFLSPSSVYFSRQKKNTHQQKARNKVRVLSRLLIRLLFADPDLTTYDNALWGFIKSIVAQERYDTIDELKDAVRRAL
ncbi:hypothetical protein ANN_23043 [Periplaneta americana]|uniref:Uncharacterized protein n=1 Tax=Periplaneta americana TaxID=6978 RepID=A0ABQ8SL89_PERAM|nr:hypothetical protein ANN_23043 [Periplaneta americana]